MCPTGSSGSECTDVFSPIAMGISVQFRAHFWVQMPSSFSTTVRWSCPTATLPSASGVTRGSSCLPVGKSSLMVPRPSIWRQPCHLITRMDTGASILGHSFEFDLSELFFFLIYRRVALVALKSFSIESLLPDKEFGQRADPNSDICNGKKGPNRFISNRFNSQ